MPSSSSSARNLPTCMSCSTMPSLYSSCPDWPRSSAFTWVRKCMRVPFHHANQGLPAACCSRMNAMARSECLVVHRFHALLRERAGVLDALATLAVGPGMDDAARRELLQEGLAVRQHQLGRVVLVLRLFLRVQVVEVAEELVEAVHRGQVLVAIALVVLAELPGGVARALQHGGHGHVGLLPTLGGARQPDLGHAAAHRHRTADEGGAASGAALLRVVVREAHAFIRDAIDVGRLVAHHAAAVVADVPGADVVAPDHEDVGLLRRGLRRRGDARYECHDNEPRA